MITAATAVRTSARRGGTRPVPPATGVRRRGAITRRRSRVIRAAPAVAATAVVRRGGAVSLRWARVIRPASAEAATAVVRWGGAITRRGPRVVGAASAVTATGASIGRCRPLTNEGRAYLKCARLRTGASKAFSEAVPAARLPATVVAGSSKLTSRRWTVRTHVLPGGGNVRPIHLARLTESMPATVVARASTSRRGRGLGASWLASTAPTAVGLATAAVGCGT